MNKKHNKEDIIEKGIQLFREKGYGNTGIQDILKSCGIPKGSFYNFFDSKISFALESIDLYGSNSLNQLQKLDLNEELTNSDKIRRFFIAGNDVLIKENCKLNCLLLSLTNEISDNTTALAPAISGKIDSMKSFIIKWITVGQENGEIKTTFPPKVLTNILYDGYHGAVTRMKYQRNDEALKHFEAHILEQIFM